MVALQVQGFCWIFASSLAPIIPQIGLYGLKYKAFSFIQCTLYKEMSKTGGRNGPQTGKWEAKEFRASQGRKNHSAVNPALEKGMEQADQAERRSCLAER